MDEILATYEGYKRARNAWLRDHRGSDWLMSEEFRKLDSAEFRVKAEFVSTVQDSEHYGMFEVYKYASEDN